MFMLLLRYCPPRGEMTIILIKSILVDCALVKWLQVVADLRFRKTSYYYNHDDWSELNLMQGLSGEKIGDQYSSTDSSSDESFDNAHVEETDENQHRNTAGEERLEQIEIAQCKAPVRDVIRRQIEEAKATDRWLVKFRLERDTWNKYHHPKKVTKVVNLVF